MFLCFRVFLASENLTVEKDDETSTGVIIKASTVFRVCSVEVHGNHIMAEIRDGHGRWIINQGIVDGIPGGGGWVDLKRKRWNASPWVLSPTLLTLRVEDTTFEGVTLTIIEGGNEIKAIHVNRRGRVGDMWLQINQLIEADYIMTVFPDRRVLAYEALPLRYVFPMREQGAILCFRLFLAEEDLIGHDTRVVIYAGAVFRANAMEDRDGKIIVQVADGDQANDIVGIPGGDSVTIHEKDWGWLVSPALAVRPVCPRVCTVNVEDSTEERTTWTVTSMSGEAMTIHANTEEPLRQLWLEIHEAIGPTDRIATVLPDGHLLEDGAVPLHDVLLKILFAEAEAIVGAMCTRIVASLKGSVENKEEAAKADDSRSFFRGPAGSSGCPEQDDLEGAFGRL